MNTAPSSEKKAAPESRAGAFTLIEIMIVVGIIGLTLSLGVPAFVNALHKEGMRKAESEILDACREARGHAILSAQTQDLVVNPLERTFEVPGAFDKATLPGDVNLDFLGVNFIEYERADQVRIHFFPNGTSDDCVIVIHSLSGGQPVKILIDPVTALTEIVDVK